jgi:arylsulfatase A-like enzyme
MSEYPNVILIVIDTLREDYAKPLEEVLKKLGFISYENVIAPASWTMPSHASMFTGLYPALHEAHETREKKHINVKFSKGEELLLSTQLGNLGYETYLLTANIFITPKFGFRGFNWYYCTPFFTPSFSENERKIIEAISTKYTPKNRFESVKAFLNEKQYQLLFRIITDHLYKNIYYRITGWPKDKGAKLIKMKLRKLNINHTEPTFIFINLMETHNPYLVNEKLTIKDMLLGNVNKSFIRIWKDKYREEIIYVTKRILEILKILKEKKVFDNSLIIITSDHGQLLGEHNNKLEHGTFLYDELLKVPLFIKYPNENKSSKVDTTIRGDKYFSLTKIKSLIKQVIKRNFEINNRLYSEVVFAESYGLHVDITPETEAENEIISNIEKYRIAIYYKNFKGIFNVTDWKFEEIISYDSKIEVTEDIVKLMKKEMIRFLNTATATKVPKIKL